MWITLFVFMVAMLFLWDAKRTASKLSGSIAKANAENSLQMTKCVGRIAVLSAMALIAMSLHQFGVTKDLLASLFEVLTNNTS